MTRTQCLLSLLLLTGCRPKLTADSGGKDDGASGDDDGGEDDGGQDDGDTDDTAEDTGAAEDPTLPDGERAVSGKAWFFDAEGVGQISEVLDVEGAEVWLLEDPSRRQVIEPDGLFRFEDLPEGAQVTVALSHPDFYPSLTATLPIGEDDVEGVTFQAVSWTIAEFLSALVGVDAHDPEVCSMVVTVTAISDNQQSVYAVGEPDVTVTVSPAPPSEAGPTYFNTSVLPDQSLLSSTTDGGVIVAGVTPGTYTWTGHKDGYTFRELTLRCEGGWMTNGSPPWGLQVLSEPE
jgi:hypothetical protein